MNSSHPLWSLLKQNSKPQHHHHHHRGSHRQARILQEASRPACKLDETFVRPRAARNRELEWRFIVNDLEEDTEYQQVSHQQLYVSSYWVCHRNPRFYEPLFLWNMGNTFWTLSRNLKIQIARLISTWESLNYLRTMSVNLLDKRGPEWTQHNHTFFCKYLLFAFRDICSWRYLI